MLVCSFLSQTTLFGGIFGLDLRNNSPSWIKNLVAYRLRAPNALSVIPSGLHCDYFFLTLLLPLPKLYFLFFTRAGEICSYSVRSAGGKGALIWTCTWPTGTASPPSCPLRCCPSSRGASSVCPSSWPSSRGASQFLSLTPLPLCHQSLSFRLLTLQVGESDADAFQCFWKGKHPLGKCPWRGFPFQPIRQPIPKMTPQTGFQLLLEGFSLRQLSVWR